MGKETRYLSRDLKNTIFIKHKSLLDIVYYVGNKIMLKEQLKAIATILEPLNNDIDNSIEELIQYGFLKEKQILTSKKYALYLTSYPISKIEGVSSRNVSCVRPSTEKALSSLIKMEYLLKMIRTENTFTTFPDSKCWLDILETRGNSLLLEKCNAIEMYDLIQKNEDVDTYFTEDFFIDNDVCLLEKTIDFNNKSKNKIKLDTNEIKSLEKLNQYKLGYTELNRNREKYFFNFKMFLGRNFVLENIKEIDNYTIKINIASMDYDNSLEVEKLFNNSGFIYEMLKRYLDKNIELEVTVYVWEKMKVTKLKEKAKEKVKILGSSEYKKYPKGTNALINAGVLESELENIKVNYTSLDITDKYNIKK